MSASNPPPQKPIPLDYLRQRAHNQFANFKHWVQHALSRDSLMSSFKTLLWLAPLTGLIWIYAEREQVVSLPGQAITVGVRSNDPNTFVRLASDPRVTVRLSGPRARLDDVMRRLQPMAGRPALVLTAPDGLSPGQRHELSAAPLIEANPIFTHNGISVENCDPARLLVYVDQFQEREFEVQVAPEIATNLTGAPVFNPARVRIHAPASEFAAAEKVGPIIVEADLAASGVLNNPGSHDVIVKISSPSLKGDSVSFSHPSVRANFQVQQASARYTYRSISVTLQALPLISNEYKVMCDETVSNVTVIGPPDKIRELREDLAKPVAVLQVTGDDRDGATRKRRLRFEDLPDPSIRVSPDDEKREIEFRLVKKTPDS